MNEPCIHISFYGSMFRILSDLRCKLKVTHDNFVLVQIRSFTASSASNADEENINLTDDKDKQESNVGLMNETVTNEYVNISATMPKLMPIKGGYRFIC